MPAKPPNAKLLKKCVICKRYGAYFRLPEFPPDAYLCYACWSRRLKEAGSPAEDVKRVAPTPGDPDPQKPA